MHAKPEDRRVQRTRVLLKNALLELIVSKGYESITVQDLIDRANIGRSTFYAHFLDKQHLLESGFKDLKGMLAQQLQSRRSESDEPGARALGFSLPMLEHAIDHHPIYLATIGKPSGAMVDQQLRKLLSDLVQGELAAVLPSKPAPCLPLDLVALAVVSVFMGLLEWWFAQPRPCPPAEIDRMFRTMVRPSLDTLFKTDGQPI